jgi:hypothetical protein
MGGSYKRCAGCGGRALSIATRCPGCGGEFPAGEEGLSGGRRTPRRSTSPSVPVVVLAGLGIVVASQVGRTVFPRERRSSYGAAVSAAEPMEVGAVPPAPAKAPPVAASGTPPVTAVLVAHRLIYMRKARSRSTPLEAVLEPGDTLTVDSLVRGWYRVTFEGEVMGYAERSSIESSSAPGR